MITAHLMLQGDLLLKMCPYCEMSLCKPNFSIDSHVISRDVFPQNFFRPQSKQEYTFYTSKMMSHVEGDC